MNWVDDRPTAVMDTECVPNYWSIAFKDVNTKRMKRFERLNDGPLDTVSIAKIFRKYRIISFNGNKYDMLMIAYAMAGATNSELKQASDDIIQNGVTPWKFKDKYGVFLPGYIDHIDLMEVSPGAPRRLSLKMYAGFLHSKVMWEFEFDHTRPISGKSLSDLRLYHENDLDNTIDLYFELKPLIDLRSKMSGQYGIDLRSKSDAQIAEAVIKHEYTKRTGATLKTPKVTYDFLRYQRPSFLRFENEDLKRLLSKFQSAKFEIDYSGKVVIPKELLNYVIKIGTTTYKTGIGGLHSIDESVTYVSDEKYIYVDRDVVSYYPSMILLCGLFPKHIGRIFLDIYSKIKKDRVSAKKLGNILAEILKIVLNGTFGKFASIFSVLYAPQLMLQTTVGGQLVILMAIDQVERNGFKVVSANTDGFVTRVERSRLDDFEAIIFDWECDTGFETEASFYKALYMRDVNAYIAVSENKDGTLSYKRKGAFAPSGPGLKGCAGLKKNPDADITVDAIIKYLADKTPYEKTIRECKDIRKFLMVRQVKGGAERNGEYIGKAIRWYYSTDSSVPITYKTNGNIVPKSKGAKPLMWLTDDIPEDLDYSWYVRECYAILQDMGADVVDPNFHNRTGYIYASLPDQVTSHIIDLKTGKAICGRSTKSLRYPWIEHNNDEQNLKICSKCLKEEQL